MRGAGHFEKDRGGAGNPEPSCRSARSGTEARPELFVIRVETGELGPHRRRQLAGRELGSHYLVSLQACRATITLTDTQQTESP